MAEIKKNFSKARPRHLSTTSRDTTCNLVSWKQTTEAPESKTTTHRQDRKFDMDMYTDVAQTARSLGEHHTHTYTITPTTSSLGGGRAEGT
jgi:hypothetical protein